MDDLEKRREIIRNFLRKHPTTTVREITQKLRIKVNKTYEGGMEEAFLDAEIPKPRTIKFKTKEEKRKILVDYVRKNPKAGGHIIIKNTKINIFSVFNNTKEMFEAAGIPYHREELRLLMLRERGQKKKEIINIIRNNPYIGIEEVGRIVKTHPYSIFKDVKEMYRLAGVNYLGKSIKIKIKKQKAVIDYIKKNPFATQREINNACKTHVQLTFDKGIFEAYEKAGVSFPFERLKLHGTTIKKIKDEAKLFEEEIAKKLSGYGAVNRLVRTKRGFADIILERKGKKVAIELKNYKIHEISISQINQLNKYLEDIHSNLGFLICLKKPKRDMFLMGENKIFILLESELSKIPIIMDL